VAQRDTRLRTLWITVEYELYVDPFNDGPLFVNGGPKLNQESVLARVLIRITKNAVDSKGAETLQRIRKQHVVLCPLELIEVEAARLLVNVECVQTEIIPPQRQIAPHLLRGRV